MSAGGTTLARAVDLECGLEEEGRGVELCAHGTAPGDVLAWAAEVGTSVPLPGAGLTRQRWEWLATLGAWDQVQARVVEPHLDARAILAEAGREADATLTWGVWAAEGPGASLDATRTDDGDWVLDGTKAWCSLAGEVSHALVTAWAGGSQRRLFAVDVRQPGFGLAPSTWQPTGLREVTTSSTRLERVAATAVGEPDWYLARPGFAWGGIGVAAVWYGGAVGVARRLVEQTRRREPDQVALMHLGAVDARLTAAAAVLVDSAARIDVGQAAGRAGALLAARVRQVVADAAEDVLARCGHALGPGVLTQEADHARRVADLGLYLRQHHAERDQAALGRLVLDAGGSGSA